MKRLLRYGRTLRHLSPRQVAARVRRKASQRWFPILAHPLGLTGMQVRALPAEAFAASCRNEFQGSDWVAAMARGRFCFLHRECNLALAPHPLTIDWTGTRARDGGGVPVAVSHLWRMHLHYFDYAGPLVEAGAEALWLDLAHDWVRQHPWGRGCDWGAAWNSFAIASRISNWAYATSRAAGPPPDWMMASVALQAQCLAAHMEFDLLANHLLRCCRGLLAAGAWLDGSGPRAWRVLAYRTLHQQIALQVLADGGHFERSPMYHLQVMMDLAECWALARFSGDCPPELGRELRAALERMANFAATVQMGDGEIPLLHDSALDTGVSAHRAIAFVCRAAGQAPPAPRSGDAFFPESGLAVLESSPLRVVVDGGPLGPAGQPAHAHCGIGNFVASWGCERLIEDTGVYQYEAGPVRDSLRSTAAHNTVCVDGNEQGECWLSFRLGRRAQVEPMQFDAARRRCRIAYRMPWVGLALEREIQVCDQGIAVRDRIGGSGCREVVLRFHLGPGVTRMAGEVLRFAGTQATLAFRGNKCLHWSVENTPFYPAFNQCLQRLTLVGRARLQLPVEVHTQIEVLARQRHRDDPACES